MSLLDRFFQDSGRAIFDGNEALIKGALEAGVGFFTGYPGSPLAGVHSRLESLRSRLEVRGLVYHMALNEMIAAAELAGSQKADVNGIAFAKNVGFLWMLDPLIYENFTGPGKDSGALVVVGDDPVAKSTTTAFDSRLAFQQIKMPYLEPATVQELKDWVGIALELSRRSRLFAGIRIVTALGDGGACLECRPTVPPRVSAKEKITLTTMPPITGPPLTLKLEAEFPQRFATAIAVAREHGLNQFRDSETTEKGKTPQIAQISKPIKGGEPSVSESRIPNPESRLRTIGLLASGKVYTELLQALDLLDLQGAFALAKIGMPFPLDIEQVCEWTLPLARVIVVEEKEPLLESALKAALYGEAKAPEVFGKVFPNGQQGFPATGELSPHLIAARLGKWFAGDGLLPERAQRALHRMELLTQRKHKVFGPRLPAFCPGCPHRETVALGQELKAGSDLKIAGDIGCYTMAYFPQHNILDTESAMGQGGAVFDGMAPFVTNAQVALVGDGTLLHSGRNSLLNAVIQGTKITYVVLDNATIAMTGHQAPPSQTAAIDLEALVRGYGVTRVATLDPIDRPRYEAVLKEFQDLPGVKVIIAKRECAITEAKRLRKEREAAAEEQIIRIQPDVCEMCFDCGQKTGCTALDIKETAWGPKMQVNQAVCYRNGSCAEKGDCPSYQVLTIERANGKGRPLPKVLTPGDLPAPPAPLKVTVCDFNVFIPGVGGMGVVTLSALLSYAAVFDGYEVTFSNRTGLAQKNGAVESHLRLAKGRSPRGLVVGPGEADLYIAVDLLEGARPVNLDLTAPERTATVANLAKTLTVLQIAGKDTYPAPETLEAILQENSRSYTGFDALAIAEHLFGSQLYANIFLLGVAFQSGFLPLTGESLEQAIRLNGRDVEANLQAFRWGRYFVAAPEEARSHLPQEAPSLLPENLDELETMLRWERRGEGKVAAFRDLVRRLPDLGGTFRQEGAFYLAHLIRYQGVPLAEEWRGFVEEVAQGDHAHGELHGFALTRTVAREMARLMTPKDEFEVARLHLDPADRERLRNEFHLQPGDKLIRRVVLSPPWLRPLIGKRKLTFGPWFDPFLRLLAAARVLRPYLPALDEVRRLERRLPGWYKTTVRKALHYLSPETYEQVVEWAGRVQEIKGYESIKLRNAAKVIEALSKNFEPRYGLPRHLGSQTVPLREERRPGR